jgi:alpha-L-arabinofuranosidase
MWCLGNELDGPWQLGHKTADEYGRLAAETARGMRMIDPDLELVACGSSSSAMPTFGEWERTVLEHAYECVDYISLHAYYEERDGDLASFLASPVDMDRFIDAVVAAADGVRARGRHRKRMALSFDEWNVWYQSRCAEASPTDWERAPRLLEDVYSVADAVVVGGLLITLLRHADRVTAACLAQLVNVIAPIRTEPGGAAWRQTTFYPFAYTARLAKGSVLRAEPRGPHVETTRFGDVAALDTVATYDDDAGQLVLFATNRDTQKTIGLEVDVTAFPDATVTQALTLGGHEIRATNSIEDPERVTPRPLTAGVTNGTLTATLSPASWSVLRLAT